MKKLKIDKTLLENLLNRESSHINPSNVRIYTIYGPRTLCILGAVYSIYIPRSWDLSLN